MFDELHNQNAQQAASAGLPEAPAASPPSLSPPPSPDGKNAERDSEPNEADGDEIPIDTTADHGPLPRFFHGGSPKVPSLSGRGKRGRRLVKPADAKATTLTAEQRLLLLDTWQRSGLPAGDFAALVGLSKHTLCGWKKKFDAEGPARLMDQPRGAPAGSRLPDLTKRSILMLKQANPECGCQQRFSMGPLWRGGPVWSAEARTRDSGVCYGPSRSCRAAKGASEPS